MPVTLGRHTAPLAGATARRADLLGKFAQNRHRLRETLQARLQLPIKHPLHLIHVLAVPMRARIPQRHLQLTVLALGRQPAVDLVAQNTGGRAVVGTGRGVVTARKAAGRGGVGGRHHGRGVAGWGRRAAGLHVADDGDGRGFEVALEFEGGRARVERLDDAHPVVPAESLSVGGFVGGKEGLLSVVGDQDVIWL